MLDRAKEKFSTTATHAATTAALGAVALAALLVGSGFMTLAVWLVLLTLTTPTMAAFIVSSFYFGLAFISVAVIAIRRRTSATKKPKRKAQAADETEATMDTVLSAFVTGMSAGRKARA